LKSFPLYRSNLLLQLQIESISCVSLGHILFNCPILFGTSNYWSCPLVAANSRRPTVSTDGCHNRTFRWDINNTWRSIYS
jgi:hypothetical protein